MFYAQKQENKWYVDNSFSRHMIGDQIKFIKLNEIDGGKVILGNNASTKITRKGTFNIDNGRPKAQYVLHVEGFKHNLLSVIQMCDQGYDLMFNSKRCEIRNSYTGKLIAIANKIVTCLVPSMTYKGYRAPKFSFSFSFLHIPTKFILTTHAKT